MTSDNSNPGITRNLQRLGVVVTESTTFSLDTHFNEDVLTELKLAFHANNPKGRFEGLQSRVAKHSLPQFVRELAYIERKLTSQKFALSGPDDPVDHAMRALDRGLLIEATDVHFANIIAAMRAKEQRKTAARKPRNRAAGADRNHPATPESVATFAENFVQQHGSNYGLIAAVAKHFKVARVTAKNRIKAIAPRELSS